MVNGDPPRRGVAGLAAARTIAATTREAAGGGIRLDVGDLVIYGSHGIGRISLRKHDPARADRREVVVVEFGNGLCVTLPLDRAAVCLRPVSTETDVVSVQTALRATAATEDETWQRRTKTARDKIVDGDAIALAEVVRNAVRRDGRPTEGGGATRLSSYERELYLQARQLLVAEIGISRGVGEAEADAWIDDQLAHGREPEPAAGRGR